MWLLFILSIIMPDNIEWQPRTPEQKQAFENTAPHLLLWGPGYSGKSEVGLYKGIWAGVNYPMNRIYLIRKTKVDLRTSLWKRFSEVMPRSMITRWDDNQMYCRIKNGSEFIGFGLESDADVAKLASSECGLAVIEEASEIPYEYYDEKIYRSVRLGRVPFHQAISLTNPSSPTHWTYIDFLEQKKPDHANVYMPTMPKEFVPTTWWNWFQGLTGVFARRYKKGEWVTLEGLVYPFDPRKHIVQSFPLPHDGHRIIAVDFGYSVEHAFVCQWWYISSDDKWYCYRQIYITGRRVEILAKEIADFCKKDGIIDPRIICDHDVENMADLRSYGLKTIPAKKDRLAGQQSVAKLFDENRIFFFNTSLVETDIQRQALKLPIKTEQEFGTYVWGNKEKEDMCKDLDDGMDTMRYAIHTTLKRPGKTVWKLYT